MAIIGSKVIPEVVIPQKEATTFYIKSIVIDFDKKVADVEKIWGNGNGDGFRMIDSRDAIEMKRVSGQQFDNLIQALQLCTYEGESAYQIILNNLS